MSVGDTGTVTRSTFFSSTSTVMPATSGGKELAGITTSTWPSGVSIRVSSAADTGAVVSETATGGTGVGTGVAAGAPPPAGGSGSV